MVPYKYVQVRNRLSPFIDINIHNLNLIIDNNAISMLDFTDEIISHGGFRERFEAFGWSYRSVVNGHEVGAVLNALEEAKSEEKNMPKVIVMNTLKGYGVEGLENHPLSHVLPANPDVVDKILKDES